MSDQFVHVRKENVKQVIYDLISHYGANATSNLKFSKDCVG